MPGAFQCGLLRKTSPFRERNALSIEGKLPLAEGPPRQTLCRNDQRFFLLVFPVELPQNRPGGWLIDQRSVPLGPCRSDERLSGFDGLPGRDQHRTAGEVGPHDGPGNFGKNTLHRSCGNVWHRLCGGRFHNEPPIQKIQAGPRKFAALQQGIFARRQRFLCDERPRHQRDSLPQNGRCPRLLPDRKAAGIHGPDEILRPEQQRCEQQNAYP